MNEADVIKEYLVALGFKVDKAGLKRFDGTLQSLTKNALKLGATVTAMSGATSVAVTQVSRRFEDLYYASQRIHASVANIRGYGFALSQLGGTAQGSRQALESVAEFLRSNPGGESFLRGMGVQTRTATGELRDMTDIMRDLGHQFRQMPYYAARLRAGMLGIDPITLQAMMRDTGEFADRYSDLAKRMGVDQDEAAQASHEFMVAVRDLLAYLDLMKDKFLLILQGPSRRVIEFFQELDTKTDGAVTAAVAFVSVFGPLVAFLGIGTSMVLGLVAAIGLLIDDFATWRKGGQSLIDWSQWSDEIDAALGGFKDIRDALADLGEALGPVAEWFVEAFGPVVKELVHSFLRQSTAGLHQMADAIRVVAALLRGDWKDAWNEAQKYAADGMIRKYGGEAPPSGASAAARAQALRGAARAGQAAGAANGLAAQAMGYFLMKGFTREQAAGIVANLSRESGLNAKAVGDNGAAFGVAQWHADRQAAFKRFAGKDIRDSSFAEQLAFVNYELQHGQEKTAGAMLKAAKTAAEAGEIVARYYERPRDLHAEAELRGRMAQNWFARASLTGSAASAAQVQINQKTDIHVQGGDASATAREIVAQQDRVNGDLVRNTKGAIG